MPGQDHITIAADARFTHIKNLIAVRTNRRFYTSFGHTFKRNLIIIGTKSNSFIP